MKNTRYIVLGLLMGFALGMSARTFTTGDVIYVKKNPSNWNWYGNTDTDGKFAYFFNNSNSDYAWSKVATGVWYCDDVLQISVPAGNWTHVILTRNSVLENPKWSNVYNNGDDSKVNKTADIVIPDNQNYLDNFRQFKDKDSHSGDMWHWSDCYFYRPTANPTSASVTKIDQADREVIKVCKQSSGDPFSLQPRLISESTGYDYNQGRTWFKWNGSQWIEIKYSNYKWGFDGADGLNETIGAVNSHTYYFLSTSIHAKQRFIEVAVTEDCSPTCEITDFGVVTSNVNAHDSTYVLDGIVAFKDANGKTLRISVTDNKGEHHVDYVNPSTPHIFSLPGLFADGTKNLKATAQFIGTSYSRQSNAYDAPNAIESIETVVIDKPQGEATTLTPKYPGTDGFKWNDGNTTDHTRSIPAYNFDTTIIYTYYEYEKAPEVPGNLIKNGDFSTVGFDYGEEKRQKTVVGCNISDYNFWGKDIPTSSNFYNDYKDPLSGDYLTGGLAVVTDANQFWRRFTKKINSKTGDHFALFDADNSGEKAAWKIATNTTYPDLKLAKGTNYMFSFWVANINNYGEMNNAAKLQFEISYSTDGGSTWSTAEKLGNPIDLNDYQDNLWHQNSHVYVAKADADMVRISVKDLNTSANPGGNDFALDDIKFQAISVVSQAIKHCQRFVVKIYEAPCTFSSIQMDTIRPKCSDASKDKYSLKVTLKYDKPQGKLTLTDNIYGEIYSEASVTETTTKVITINNLAADGKSHTLTAKFTKLDDHNVDKGCEIVGNYTAPGIPDFSVTTSAIPAVDCNATTFTIDVTTTYAYQSGTQLLYYWDNALHSEATKTISYGPSTTITTTLTGLKYDGLPHTLDVKTNNGTHDCDTTIAIPAIPYTPKINTLTITGIPDTVPCGTIDYLATVEISTPYDATGYPLKLSYTDNGTSKDTLVNATGTKTTVKLDLTEFNTPTSLTMQAVFNTLTPACPISQTYKVPVMRTCIRVDTTICEGTSFFWDVDNKYYTGTPGLNKYISGTDTLYLTVIAMPAITIGTMAVTCDSESSIRIPFSGPTGVADTIEIAIGMNHYKGSIVGSDIVFTRATELVAGDYSANVTIGTKGQKCNQTVAVNFSIALGNAMYSKWTDVLFVDNKDGKFVSYQWYENGVAMSGETQQRLYRPEGLPGAYYCQIMTTDGITITTCEQSFDKIQPSRSAGQAPKQVIRKYRVSPHVYIIQTETDGMIETKKILTPYE